MKSQFLRQSFPTTLWTQVVQAKEGYPPSIDGFYRRYASPVYCFFRAKRVDSETAKDLTQDLFVKLTNGKLLGHLRPRRHRFRSYLMQAAKNQWIDYLKKRSCEISRRIGPLDDVLDTIDPHAELSRQVSPEDAFQRRSARALLAEALRQVERECHTDGLGSHFKIFSARFLEPQRYKWEQIGQMHGISGQKASNMARTVTDRFRAALCRMLRLEYRTHEEVEDEIRRFISSFSTQTDPAGHSDGHATFS